ncbi:MAG: response regulator [Thermoflexales bacterium]|nr:response regulator [Thermoflexales bacterium]
MPTILIIDDEEGTRVLARMALGRQGYTVLEEADAQAGIATARSRLPDLILMDISMPLLDGWTATRVLKADPAMAHIPIVAWTALNIGGEQGALMAGYDGYLPKPVDMSVFVEQIAVLLPEQPPETGRPPAAAQVFVSQPQPLIAPSSLAEARLLLLADDPATIEQVRREMTGRGYSHIRETADLPVVLKAAIERQLDLILLDLDLTYQDGFKVLRQLRSDARLENVPVLAITAVHTDPADVKHGLELGANDYFSQPVDWDELVTHLASRLRIKLLEDKLRRRQIDMEVLYRASQVLGASLDPAMVLAVILEQAAASVEAGQGSLYLLDKACQPIHQLHTSGVPDVPPDRLEAMFDEQTRQWSCRLLEPAVVENTPQRPYGLRLPADAHTRSSLLVPLVGREGVMGVLVLDHDEADYFSQEHLVWLTALTAQAAVALDNARLFEQVRGERKKLSAILDSSADGIVVVDDEMRITLVNAPARQVLALRVEQIGQAVQIALPKDNPLTTLFGFAELRQEPVVLEVDIGKGTYHTTVRPVPGLGYVAALHDISLVKEIEQMELERERQKTEHVRHEFERHFSPQVVELLLKRGETLSMLRKCEAAVLFSDLRNYTGLTERLGLEVVVEYVLKRYITVMTDMVYTHEGMINKILGDGIMAVFGVPLPQANAPQRALRTALAMQRALAMLREGWLRELNQEISMGVGLAWGVVVAGDIGGVSKRVDYTVIGDAVNLAARLGEMAAPGEVLLAESLAQVVGVCDEWRLEELPPVKVKGKEHPQCVYRAELIE